MIRRIFYFIFLLATGPAMSQDYYLLTGTYDSPKSEGIYVYRFNSADASVKEVSHIKTSNPSYLSISPDQRFVYAVHENANNGKGGSVASFSFNKTTGVLVPLSLAPTLGDHPCYVETDKTGEWVFAGNYTSGSISVMQTDGNGNFMPSVSLLSHQGSGPDTARQKSPHVHCTYISPDNKYLFVPDLGTDKVMIYNFDAATGRLTSGIKTYAGSVPGSGPRHFILHPNQHFGYLIEELSGTVVAFKYKKGKLKRIQRISTMPAGDTRFPGSADIHMSKDGRFLYASNRANVNTIAIYSVSNKGKLKLIGHQSTLGKGPRNFNFDPTEKYLLVGNQNSDEIVIFERNSETGLLTDTGKRIAVGKPVCIKWIPVN
jgi:6-phosphogluconolactonase